MTRSPGYRPLRSRYHTDLPRLLAKRSAVIDPEPTLRLPLVHHLVQHCMLDLGPRMSSQVPATDRDLERLAGPDLHCQLTQPGAHAAGQSNRNLAQCSTEVLGIELMMKTG